VAHAPRNGIEDCAAGVLRLDALDYALRKHPFLAHVPWRGDEDADGVDFGHALTSPCPMCAMMNELGANGTRRR
jgi:hypothetical protein